MAGVKIGCEDARKKGKKKKTFGRKKIYGLREALHTQYEGTLVQKKAKEGVCHNEAGTHP